MYTSAGSSLQWSVHLFDDLSEAFDPVLNRKPESLFMLIQKYFLHQRFFKNNFLR